ncbi:MULTISPECIES: hypothetical protein [unclassified Virgibacillus]|uniref:hypothetical protein n=1 Tax=unclassified Virgibacillus TaxID=2620237 RepID=UPI0024DE8C06|nr:hypothetical protein [Virgibacillus sp. LDC-1]
MVLLSWKSIEMQVALPRVQDAGKQQEQMLKQNQHFQESLAQSQLKQELAKRKKVNELEQFDYVKMNKQEEKQQHERHKEEKKDEQEKQARNEHPYLGNTIDYRR